MALKKENLPTSREQLKKLSLLQVKALRKYIRLKIRKLKPGRGCQTPEFTALKKLNLMLKDEIVDRRIAAEMLARPSAEIIQLLRPVSDTAGSLLDVFDIEPVAPLRAVGHVIRA